MDKLKLRQATDLDYEFAYETKKTAFRQYIEQVWGWDEEKQRRLHERRFRSQDVQVIEVMGVDVGIIAIVREPDCIKIKQIFILPEYQSRGIGRACVRQVIREAATLEVPVRLQVLKVNNHAVAFFGNMGFRRTDESDTHITMERLSETT